MSAKSPCPFPPETVDVVMSHTRADKGRWCPWFWSLAYREVITGNPADKVYAESSPQRDRGGDVHDIAGRYATHCLGRGLEYDHDELQRITDAVCLEMKRPTAVKDEVRKLAAQFGASHRFDPLEKGEVWGAEKTLWCLLNGPAKPDGTPLRIAFQGRLDLFRILGDRAWVLDYKTGYRIMDSLSFKGPAEFYSEFQSPLYLVTLMANYPQVKHGTATFDYIARDFLHEKTIKDYMVEAALKWLFDTSMMVYLGIQAVRGGTPIEDAFPPRPGKACEPYDGAPCDFLAQCTYRQKCDRPIIRTPQDAVDMLADYLQGKVLQDSKYAALKGYVATNGPVACNGKVLDCGVTDKVELLDKPAAIQALVDAGEMDNLSITGLVKDNAATETARWLTEQGFASIEQEPTTKLKNDERSKK